MLERLKKYQNSIKDFFYSFVAYALPTLVLQFAVYPLVAARIDSEENGLFLTMLSVARLCVSVLILPLSNVRLLNKKQCAERPENEKNYNFLLLFVVAFSAVITVLLNFIYRDFSFDVFAFVRLTVVVLLLCAHDYYSIAFRVAIDYKLIVIDNLLIVAGYAIGVLLMWVSGYWELVFICGYTLGLGFVLIYSSFWRQGVRCSGFAQLLPQYGSLCASSGLNNATIYCDKMMIYPMLGGHAVSVYNSAAIVSKAMALVSVPLRNVLLSYMVDMEQPRISKRMFKRACIAALIGAVVMYLCFGLASVVLCKLLYPKFYDEAICYVPIILLAVLFETSSGILKTVLLRYAKSILQILVSAVKIAVYVGVVLLLSGALHMGLQGFCLAILLADAIQLVLVLYFFIRSIIFGKPVKMES